jgi:hypothetical protein
MASTPQEYCRRCDAALAPRAKHCPGCGRHLLPYWWVWGLGILGLAYALVFASIAWDAHTFNAMTPAQHLSRANAVAEQTANVVQVAEGLQHARAVPANSSDAANAAAIAVKLEGQLKVAEEVAKQEQAKSAKPDSGLPDFLGWFGQGDSWLVVSYTDGVLTVQHVDKTYTAKCEDGLTDAGFSQTSHSTW